MISRDDVDLILSHPMFEAVSGKCGEWVFFMSANNNKCVRRHIIPRDPRSSAQIARRQCFKVVVREWQSLPDSAKMIWRSRANSLDSLRLPGSKAIIGYNLFISINLLRLYAGRKLLKVFNLPLAHARLQERLRLRDCEVVAFALSSLSSDFSGVASFGCCDRVVWPPGGGCGGRAG